MIVVCANCIAEDTPGFLEEKPPYTDDRVSHGICKRHVEQYRERLRKTLQDARPITQEQWDRIARSVPTRETP